MEEVASTAKLVDPGAAATEGALTATFPRSQIEAALQDEGGADLMLEIARIQNGERNDTTVTVAWEREDLEKLLAQASGDQVSLSFDPDELQRMIDEDVEAHGFREKALILTVAAVTAAGAASAANAYVADDGGATPSAAVSGIVTDTSSSGVPGAVAGFQTDASTAGTTDTAAPADGWMSGVESPAGATVPQDGWIGGAQAAAADDEGINIVTDTTSSGVPGSVSGFATDASTSGQTGSVSGFITDTGSERTRNPAEPATGGGGFSIPDDAAAGALAAAGLALLITGAAFVGRTRRREQPA